jgi:hypothetical protein
MFFSPIYFIYWNVRMEESRKIKDLGEFFPLQSYALTRALLKKKAALRAWT